MGDKFDGALASGGQPRMVDTTLADAMHGISLHESLLASDEEGNVTLFRAMQNPIAGGLMIVSQPAEKNKELMLDAIAKSQMLSMLRDSARCEKYSAAIMNSLQLHPNSRVLDIGTGTGLLAKIAAKHGALHVDAIEMFGTLAQLARETIEENNLSSKITVYESCSSDMSAKHDSESHGRALYDHSGTSFSTTDDEHLMIPARADMLVTEIFDSALLGEGCLESIKHAHEHLLKQNAVVVPAKARVFGIVLNSEFLTRFFRLPSDFPIHRSADGANCIGYNVGIPIHLNALNEHLYEILSDPFQVFSFDFTGEGISSCSRRTNTIHVPRKRKGSADVVMTWWELDLCGNGKITYSTKPGTENWQDHWLPMIYPLLRCNEMTTDQEEIIITAEHNELKMSFTHGEHHGVSTESHCTCGLHIVSKSPYRLFHLGNIERLRSLSSRIQDAIKTISCRKSNTSKVVRCLDVSDSGVCTSLAVQYAMSSDRVEVVSIEEDDEVSSFVFGQIASRLKRGANDSVFEFSPLSTLIERDVKLKNNDHWEPFDLLLSEPYTRAMSAYPLATLGNLMVQIRAATEVLRRDFLTVPSQAEIYVQLLRFPPDTLQNNFEPVSEVQGFKYTRFGKICEVGDWQERERTVSLPLFQYVSETVSQKVCVHQIQLASVRSYYDASSTEVQIVEGTRAEMISLWVEYDGEDYDTTQRYETVWFTQNERRDIVRSGGLKVRSQFDGDSGVWNIGFEPLITL